MKLIIAFVKPFKLEQVRDSLKTAGVSGMSVSDISGFGRQGGQTEVYRGAEYEVEFVPKVRLEVIVTDELAGPAMTAIESAAHTGRLATARSSSWRSKTWYASVPVRRRRRHLIPGGASSTTSSTSVTRCDGIASVMEVVKCVRR